MKYIGILLRSKITYIVLILIIVVLGCVFWHKSIEAAETIVEYNVPFAASGSRWNEIKLMGMDAYGRRLYQYESIGVYTNVFSDYITYETRNTPVLVYIICQKSGLNTLYCYENSYMYSSTLIKKGDEKLERFKEENDWNKPLSEEKMIPYSINKLSELTNYSNVNTKEKAVKALENALSQEINDYYIDAIFTSDTRPIYILRDFNQSGSKAEGNMFGKSYVFIVSDESNAVYSELTGSIDDWRDQINTFKSENYN